MGASLRSPAGWRCPDCGRRFRHRTREHSCSLTSLGTHLQRTSPQVRDAFQAIERILEDLGPVHIVPLKTMIVFSTTTSFGGVRFAKARLDLGFFLTHHLRHDRIFKVERLSPHKFAHHVHVSAAAQVDSEIGHWLREAYQGSTSGGSGVP